MTIQHRTADHAVSVQYIGDAREPVVVVDRATGIADAFTDTIDPDAADPRRGRRTGNFFLTCRTAA